MGQTAGPFCVIYPCYYIDQKFGIIICLIQQWAPGADLLKYKSAKLCKVSLMNGEEFFSLLPPFIFSLSFLSLVFTHTLHNSAVLLLQLIHLPLHPLLLQKNNRVGLRWTDEPIKHGILSDSAFAVNWETKSEKHCNILSCSLSLAVVLLGGTEWFALILLSFLLLELVTSIISLIISI